MVNIKLQGPALLELWSAGWGRFMKFEGRENTKVLLFFFKLNKGENHLDVDLRGEITNFFFSLIISIACETKRHLVFA